MIKFNSRDAFYKNPFGAVEIEKDITLRLLVSRRISAFDVNAVFESDGIKFSIPLQFEDTDGAYEAYSVTFDINSEGLYFYWFEIRSTSGKTHKIGENNLSNPFDENSFSPWKLTVYINSFTATECYEGANIYQIFPDRFCKAGVPDASKHSNLKQWGETPNHIRNTDGTLNTTDFFGGNFKGIESKLEYLHDLGIDVIYLNPIFESASNHRYDTGDYEKPDSMLGTVDDFQALCKKANDYGIRIILDGVFSHTGADSKYFNKYGNYSDIGAYQSKKSAYYPWFRFRHWRDDYECWWDVKILPNTNETESSFLEFITGENGIARKWLRYGAAGWRLDVADELPDKFLEKFRSSVKAEKKDALIIGEVWENAADKISYGQRRKYLHGKQIDSVMNYVFRNAVIDFIQNRSAKLFCERVLEICEDYPSPVLNVLMNFLGTHDTERIKTVLGDEKPVCLAYAVLAFLPGLPTIYYGDETGMDGGKDPLNRMCFPWGNENNVLITFFAKINKIRHSINCLKDGRFVPLWAENGLLIFARVSNGEKCVFAVNTDNNPKILPDVFQRGTDLYSSAVYAPEDTLDGFSFFVICYGNTTVS